MFCFVLFWAILKPFYTCGSCGREYGSRDGLTINILIQFIQLDVSLMFLWLHAGFLLPASEVFPAAALQRPTNDGPRGPLDLTEKSVN